MQTNYRDVYVTNTTDPPHTARTSNRPVDAGSLAMEADNDCLHLSLGARPMDWDDAMSAAGALVDELRPSAENQDEPVVTGLVEELAAFLCAYGLLPHEVSHEQVRPGQRPELQERTHQSADGLLDQ